MRKLITLTVAVIIIYAFNACNSSSPSPQTFCDTTCDNDTLKFAGKHPLQPYIYISFNNCNPDTLLWSYNGMGVNRKMGFSDLFSPGIKLNTNYVHCVFNDTSYAWLMFNDCSYGRGYYLKIPFNKSSNIGRSGRAINNLDKKFPVDESMVAYTDRGNIFVEDMKTGKKAMMTFGKEIDMDPDDIHSSIDSVNISPSRIWAKVKIDGEWKTLEKSITLQ